MEFVALLLINLTLVALLAALSFASSFRHLAGSAINPLLVFCLITLLFNIDFVVVWNNPGLRFIERAPLLSADTVVEAYWRYTAIFSGAVLGIVCAVTYGGSRARGAGVQPLGRQQSAAVAANIVFWAVLAFCTVALVATAYLRPADNLSYQMVARQNPLSAIAAWIIPGAVALFMAHQARPSSLWPVSGFVCALLLVVFTGGVRVIPLVCLLVAAVTLAGYKRVSALWCFPVIPPAALFLAYSRYVFREQANYASFADFISASGGFIDLFFLSEELSFAKMFTAVYELSPSLPLPPFISVIAFLLAPVPRSVLPEKPYGLSAFFTQHASPERWEWTKSESLVTGYGDLYWQFGALGAFVAMAILASFWMYMCLAAIRTSSQATITWMPLLIWSMYIFVRGDIFNVSLLLMPAVMVVMLHRFLTRMLAAYALGRVGTGVRWMQGGGIS